MNAVSLYVIAFRGIDAISDKVNPLVKDRLEDGCDNGVQLFVFAVSDPQQVFWMDAASDIGDSQDIVVRQPAAE